MRIFVINLVGNVDRRNSIVGQLDRLGLEYDVVPAVSGKELSAEELACHYDDKRFKRSEGRRAAPGEIGCALSHIGVYRRIVNEDIPRALILEDDAWLNPNLPMILEAMSDNVEPSEAQVFLLTWFVSLSRVPRIKLWSSYELGHVKKAYCSHGYVVTQSAARRLTDVLYPVKRVADCWDWLIQHRIVEVLAICPTCVTADLRFESAIAPDVGDAKTSVLASLRYKLGRLFWKSTDYLISLSARVRRTS
jgi:glycosyl transferase, family 25